MEPEDSAIWVEGLDEESLIAFTDFGSESRVEVVKIHRKSAPREER